MDDNEWLDIESITGYKDIHRGNKKVRQYLVKWTASNNGTAFEEWVDADRVPSSAVHNFWYAKELESDSD